MWQITEREAETAHTKPLESARNLPADLSMWKAILRIYSCARQSRTARASIIYLGQQAVKRRGGPRANNCLSKKGTQVTSHIRGSPDLFIKTNPKVTWAA